MDYVVLGDDIAIFSPQVASEYLKLMSELGVGINLIKSVVSKDSLEFAKRFYCKGENVSPVSFKEMDVAAKSIDAALLLLEKVLGKDGVTPAIFAKFRGAGYRVLGTLDHQWEDLSSH